ncbi:uncharacterized protein [Triticum aestivum]|uniref:uncharacterized protein n=1 Tax=Triticum aestivum TaxID=4565 RepID=UPI001D019D98|nr:uncharacterized protein LOC123133717 [Triticum aestivum]
MCFNRHNTGLQPARVFAGTGEVFFVASKNGGSCCHEKSWNWLQEKLQPANKKASTIVMVTTSYIDSDHKLHICWKRHHGVLQPVVAEASTGHVKAATTTRGKARPVIGIATTGDRGGREEDATIFVLLEAVMRKTSSGNEKSFNHRLQKDGDEPWSALDDRSDVRRELDGGCCDRGGVEQRARPTA